MQYSLYINQLFIANHPECNELDIIDVAIFDCVRKLIAGNWGEKKLEGKIMWANVSVSKILQEMPLLRNGKGQVFKQRAIHGRISKLCDAGLLQKWDNNQKTATAFIALGNLAKEYDSYTRPLHLDANPIASECKPPLHVGADNKNTIQNTLSNSLDSDSASESLPKEKRVPKKKLKLTRIEVQGFYESELTNSLKDPLPPELLAAAARRPEITHELLFKAYKELVDYMTGASDMWPNGMWRCVLTKPDQLSFVQFCKLVLERGMTRAEIKSYLDQWENKLYDNNNLYATIVSWRNRETTNPQKPFNGTGQQQSKGLSVPKRVEQ